MNSNETARLRVCVCVCVCDARTKALILGKLEEIVQVLADNNTGLDVGRERHCAFVGWSAKNKTTTTTKKKTREVGWLECGTAKTDWQSTTALLCMLCHHAQQTLAEENKWRLQWLVCFWLN